MFKVIVMVRVYCLHSGLLSQVSQRRKGSKVFAKLVYVDARIRYRFLNFMEYQVIILEN